MRLPRSRLAVAALVAVALPLAAELGWRGWLWAAGEPYSSARAAARMSALDGAMDVTQRDPEADRVGQRVPSPFFAWEEVAIQDGLRATSEYFATPEADAAYDVLIVGGAGALRFAGEGFDLLTQALVSQRPFAERPIRSHVLARDGGKQPQQLNVVAYVLMLGWKPDLVLNLDGRTELVEGMANKVAGAHPFQPAASIWGPLDLSTGSDRDTMDHLLEARAHQNEARRAIRRARALRLHRSAILGCATLRRLEASAARVAAAVETYETEVATKPRIGVTGPGASGPPSKLLESIADTWRHTSISLDAICRARGIEYLHVLEPGSEGEDGQTVRRGYPLLLERAEDLRARGVLFVDGSRLPLARKLARRIALTLLEVDG
jgi:hypothetical protein